MEKKPKPKTCSAKVDYTPKFTKFWDNIKIVPKSKQEKL